eukprot:jgi/Tetstr1/431945/TSEL_002252.t1
MGTATFAPLVLAALLLVAGTVPPAAAASGEELAEQVAEAAEAQEYREEAAAPVVSDIIPEDAPAELNAGTGDISTTGACSVDIDEYCVDSTPGAGRIADCLSGQIREADKIGDEANQVSKECQDELEQFKIDRATNINKDIPLAVACADDVKQFCTADDLYDEPGAVLTCLREVKEELTSACAEEVYRTQKDAVEDFRTDAMLHELCQADADSLCEGVPAKNGKVQDCLREKRPQLSWDCQEELFRQEVENADDLRLSTKLYQVCLPEKRKHCAKVVPGANRAKDCLEDHMHASDFDEHCKAALEEMQERRAADFRLDATLRDVCMEDIDEVCGYEKESLDSIANYDGRVSNCLMDYRDEIMRPECQARVHKMIAVAAGDIRMDIPLADACHEDRTKYCADVAPGSARVIRCLQDQRESLSFECRATLFDQEVRMSESLDFQYPMKKACKGELKQFCAAVPAGNARQIRCLQEHTEDADMGPACREEVERQEHRQSEDYRLNFRLQRVCELDMEELCGEQCTPSQGTSCGGTVLRCLTDKRDKIQDQACKDEVFYFIKMEVNDFRNDVLLAEACRNDVAQFCSGVEGGDGRVHSCLRQNREQLSPKCKEEEEKLNIIQSTNIEFRPRLKKLCREERSVFCKGVKPGRGRVIRCLQENVGKSSMGDGCRSEINRRQIRRMKDYKLDFGVAKECQAAIKEGVCKDAKDAADGENSAVLVCLTHKFAELEGGCQSEVARAVRMALWSYTPGMKLTEECDAPAVEVCGFTPPVSVQWGAVGRCLKKNLATLPKTCAALVEVGAPEDVRTNFMSTMSVASMHSSLRKVERAVGFKRGTLVAKKKGVRGITLTGWSALAGLASLMVVLLGGVYALVYQRRYGALPTIDPTAGTGPMVVKGKR